MSITTKRGDKGLTDLLYGRRITKTDIRLAAYGTVDELTAAIGMARAQAAHDKLTSIVDELRIIQQELIPLMGELATEAADLNRYEKDGFERITTEHVERITQLGKSLEMEGLKFNGWVIPGAAGNRTAAALDFARAVARRAERDTLDLAECEKEFSEPILIYLNRLSDILWLLARSLES